VTALAHTRDLLTLAMDASQLGWGTWNLQTGETEWDARGKAIIGFAEEAEARSAAGWLARIHPADRYAFETYMHQLAEGERFRTEYRVVHPNGAVRIILGTGIFFQEESSGAICGTGLVQDITEQRQTEAELRRLTETLETQVALRTEQVRALASTLTMVEHEERRHISQILHDDLQQLLYGIQMRMMMVIESIKSDGQESLLSTAQEVYRWLSDAIETTRGLTVELSPPVLEGEGLAEALDWLITQMAQVYRLHVDLQTAANVPVTDKEMRVLLFQIVRELLFNVFNQATVALDQDEGGGLLINVSDAGRGFDVTAAEARHDGGFGLFSVRERLGLFGGQMVIDSAPGAGTRITIHTPAIHKVHALDR
jgi:signal transduction histidine kinase